MISTALELEFADGEYLFDLKLPQLAELQEKRGPVFEIYGRVLKGRYLYEGIPIADTTAAAAHSDDIFETIRLALIGGGRGIVNGDEVEVSQITARNLVERYCHAAPLKESWAVAAAILAAKVEGYEPKKDEPGKDPATEKPKRARKKSTSNK